MKIKLTLLHLYNSELSSVLDKHAPLKSRMVTIRPAAPWFSEEIKLERRVRRRLERRWRRTRKTLIHAFFTARIDYCNSLLYGQPKCILKRLQSVLNSAARLIHLTSRYEHVTPLLIQLHWLPIEQRITFKIAVITFKALLGAAPSHITDLIKPYTPGGLVDNVVL